MGSNILIPIFACLLLGAVAVPPELEFMARSVVKDRSTNLDDPKYRLTDVVQPKDMYVDLDVYLQEARFNGFVRLDVQTREENLRHIVMHQKVVSIQTVNVVDSVGRPVNLQFPDPYTTDDYYEILSINFADPLPIGNYSISIRYQGAMNLNQLENGFYRGYYFLNNEIRYYATTQFQPYHARMAFPCFDEPQFKSRFIISITRDPSLSPSYSNMPIALTSTVGERLRETFFATPIVSAYLVAFTVSDFVETNYTHTNTRPFGIVSRPGVTNQHLYAAETGLAITNVMDDYFGIDYNDMGQGQPMKNDHLAIPDFAAGAMENWGMVNYREAYLLYDENHTNLINKIFISTLMAHELAHKWFGNLVTCFWWSNLWLNESFASLFEYFSAHEANPSLELDDQFVVDQVHSALDSDSFETTAMNFSEVDSNPSISSHFSVTSYAKGASVLRMMEHFLGPRCFRMGLRYYLRENAYGIGTPQKLYDALRRAAAEDMEFRKLYPNVDVGAILDNWVQNPGSPVVNVHVNMSTGLITLTQERFYASPTEWVPNTRWHIPITWTHSGNFSFQNTRPSFIFSGDSHTIQNTPGHNFVILNIAQSGLYRVNYDDHNWEMIAAFLRRNNNNRLTVHKLNRAQIVNDVVYFIRAGKIDIDRAFDVLSFLSFETDYYVWAGAIGQLNWIRSRMEHLPKAHELFTTYMLQQMATVINHLGYDERSTDSTSTILNRMQIMNLACNLGHAGCISDSLRKWNSFKQNSSNLVPVNQRRYVYCVGLREGDSSDYDFLMQRYMTSENAADMVVMLRALACTKNTTSLNHYLHQTLINDRIRLHDRTNAFAFALQGNRENLDTVLEFLFEHFAAIREAHGGESQFIMNLLNIVDFLTNFADIERFRTWVNQNQLALGSSFFMAFGVVNLAMDQLTWGSENALAIHTSVLARSSAATVTTPLMLLLALLAIHFIR
uniref:Aminopeptidase n=1 Tax=Chilo suppressalis TaxID=168631 RepID=G9C7N4_CHISP|nr:aminopeptidase N4 [Chilo suppressalis]